ncbi:outer membrane protein transport protein [Bacteroidales bacterium OttesenSCG-928-M11]|nr:outer membrane protein transport protein [Bacteroidales bacterium OttesenSCG-928-M11]
MKKYLFLLALIWVVQLSFAQGELDAYRLSKTDLSGTARGQAMGGAFGAVGGDITGVMINPAGVGVYRSSEITTTMSVPFKTQKTTWNGNVEKDNNTYFRFNNLSYVAYSPTGGDFLKSVNFAFSYNRLQDFSSEYTASGKGMKTGLADYISNLTNGTNSNHMDPSYDPYKSWTIPWISTLAWQGWLIDEVGNKTYAPALLEANSLVDPLLYIKESGAIHAYDFAVAGNWGHTLYLGATFTLADVDYRKSTFYKERYPEEDASFTLNNYMDTEGVGYQLKLGAIWRPIDALRMGVSYHSPTWYSLTDRYYAELKTIYPDQIHYEYTPDGATRYKFHTPYSWTFSLAGVIGTKAIVSFDYEIKDYKSMNLTDYQGVDFHSDNEYIDQDFKLASVIRAGLEYKITPQLAARLGFATMESPYTSNLKNDNVEPALIGTIPHYLIEGRTNYYTGGLGYRFTPNIYLDFAFVHRTQESDLYYFPSVFYVDNETNELIKERESTPASLKSIINTGLLTFGYKF